MEYTIYCDESDSKGKYFSHFYGGALVRSTHLVAIESEIKALKWKLNLYNEVKWTKVTERYLPKYMALMDLFFSFVCMDQVKVRIMFTKNSLVPTNLTEYHHENGFHILYHQFIKSAFGLEFSNPSSEQIKVRAYLDWLPDRHEKNAAFKDSLHDLQYKEPFLSARLRLDKQDIAEVDSREHPILQCTDIILGAMCFRLNDKHKIIPVGHRVRGSKTRAKEKLYKHILGHICTIHQNFNIGYNTPFGSGRANIWHHPYRHWLFKPSQYREDNSKRKHPK